MIKKIIILFFILNINNIFSIIIENDANNNRVLILLQYYSENTNNISEEKWDFPKNTCAEISKRMGDKVLYYIFAFGKNSRGKIIKAHFDLRSYGDETVLKLEFIKEKLIFNDITLKELMTKIDKYQKTGD